MAKSLQTVRMADILPPNLLADANMRAIAAAIDAEMDLLIADIVQCRHLPRLDELPEIVIDLLAWQWHVDFYESTLPIAQKQDLVRKSIAWHRRKGTPYVVEEVVKTIFADGTIPEWFQYGGQPFKFKVETSSVVPDTATYNKLLRLITAVKNTRSHLEKTTFKREHQMPIYVGIAMHIFKQTTIQPGT